MNAIVLGAGVVGTTTAWFLKKQGFDVLVIDRQNQAAQETSFANGGQISVSHALPWANPHVFGNVWRWLFKKNAPLLWHFVPISINGAGLPNFYGNAKKTKRAKMWLPF